MSLVKDGETCVTMDEKRFIATLTERYLLTIKSSGVVGLVELVCDLDHSLDMWSSYCAGRAIGCGWVARGRVQELVPAVFKETLSRLSFGVGGDEFHVPFVRLGLDSGFSNNTTSWDDGDGVRHDLKDMIPAPECFTRVL